MPLPSERKRLIAQVAITESIELCQSVKAEAIITGANLRQYFRKFEKTLVRQAPGETKMERRALSNAHDIEPYIPGQEVVS